MALKELYQCKCSQQQKEEIVKCVDKLRKGRAYSAEIILNSLKNTIKNKGDINDK